MTTPSTQLEEHRVALTGHCYRMLGSIVDAEDAVQETMVRAWKGLNRFDARSSLKTWLHRIATNVCLDISSERSRRARPMEEGPAGSIDSPLTKQARTHWLEPVPDALVLPKNADPAELSMLRQSIRLAFVAALQHLPPKQRAVLLLVEVLGWSAFETGESLGMTVAAVNSALQRARATLAERNVTKTVDALTSEQEKLLDRYVDAFHRYDIEALAALLQEDATMSMPPFALWLQGPESIRQWLRGPGSECEGSRLVPVSACGLPAFAQYRYGGRLAWGLIILEMDKHKITAWNSFLDTETLFPRFGLPLQLST